MTLANTRRAGTGPTHVPSPAPLARTAAVWLAGSSFLLLLAVLCLGAALLPLAPLISLLSPQDARVITDSSPLTPPQSPTAEAVMVLAGLAGTIACLRLWWILSSTCAAAAQGRAPRHDTRTRRLVLAACGVALTVTTMAPAQASDLSSLDGLPLPERPSSSHTHRTPASPAPQTPETHAPAPHAPAPHAPASHPPSSERSLTTTTRTHVVAPGDNLWEIARTHSPDTTTAATVAALHASNADVIGSNPDLLLPGQVLTLTASHPGAASDDASTEPTPAPTPLEETR